jgi:hypothetical protein
MSFQFCCPQGHVLQGDPSQVGQLFQCPICGSNFLIPPPEISQVPPAGFFQGPGAWPAANAPGASFPGQMPAMMPPPNMPLMPGMPPGPFPNPAEPFSNPAGQIAFGPFAVNPPGQAAGSPGPANRAQPQQPQATSPPAETDRPRFELGFDPHAKAALPFEIPGEGDGTAGPLPAAGQSLPLFPAPAFPSSALPAPDFSAGGEDLSPTDAESAAIELAGLDMPTILHIRCPSGHLVKATSDLLGKNGRCPACKKTFELRYENSVEFRRRKEKIREREEVKSGKAWIAWAFLAAFLAFVALIAMMLVMNR